MRILFVTLLLLFSTGCATKQVATIPISTTCLGKPPIPPTYLYGVGDYPGDILAAEMLRADLADAKGYILELKAQMAACK